MIYKLSHYRHLKPAIEYQLKLASNRKLDDILSNSAINTMAPIIVVGHLLQELGNNSEELKEKLTRLKAFYKDDVDID